MDLQESREFLLKTKKKNKIAGAYIIYGGTRGQRNEISLFFSTLLSCKNLPPCGYCAICEQIKKKIYPDVKWIISAKKTLSIDDVRWVKNDIYITPYTGERKIYIFDIEYMKDEAANALLKILEEPPLHSLLIIQSGNINTFLSTIISRCQKIRLNYTIPEYKAEVDEAGELFLSILADAKKRDFFNFFKKIDLLVKENEREEIEEWLEMILLLYRDASMRKNGLPQSLISGSKSDATVKLPGKEANREIIEKILELKREVRYNINLKLGLDNLFLHIAQM